MKIVHVKASREYDVRIGGGLLATLGENIPKKAKTVCIVSESNVWPLHGNAAAKSITDAGYEVISFVFPAGEASKCGATFLELVNFLAENRMTRTDCLVALGGGVVGDLTGFAAATFLRGIPFIQIPTTLLAAVDSSVGGKTAIDLPAGKNLCGAFYQPTLVLCDTDLLLTLPEDIFRDGCAEVIKYGILYDPALFAHLKEHGMNFHREDVITRCVELKRDVVAEDEFDTGARMKLNLGHTIGHGVEALSHFSLSHGKSVAIGMAIVARAACEDSLRKEILDILNRFGLPTDTDCAAEDIYACTLSDKKRAGGTVSFIIPRKIGYCDIVPTPVEDVKAFIEKGL